jgi:DNA-binding transcriptional LysR family regulator
MSWDALEVRHLKAFRAVAQTRSFARAALELGYTQSAISMQIASLEKVVGARLFDRGSGRREVGVTRAGEALFEHVDALLQGVAGAELAVQRVLATEERPPLRLGTFQSLSQRVIPAILTRFHALLPDVEVVLAEAGDDRAHWAALQRAELDLGFTLLPVDARALELVEVLRVRHALVVPADHWALHADDLLRLRDGRPLPLVTYRSRPGDHLAAQLRALGVGLRIVQRSDDNRTIQGLVAAGVGVAVMPWLAVERADPSVRMLDMEGLLQPRIVALAWARDRLSAGGKVMVDAALHTCRVVEQEGWTRRPEARVQGAPAALAGGRAEQVQSFRNQ